MRTCVLCVHLYLIDLILSANIDVRYRLFPVTMVKDSDIPFEVGQLAETRSFLPGYRGAWFRCKITKISWRKDRIGHVLHYIDFPDEKEEWTESYQMPPPIEPNRKRKEPPIGQKMGTEKERQIMLRPPYPPIYRDNQLPLAGAISEVIVITEGIWYVGDLVDWWKDGCYWSGKVMQILSNEEAVVELMPPPMGEGQSYNVSFSDLRPSLEWSPEDGWTVPTPKEGNYRQCARLVYPGNQTFVSRLALEVPAKCEVTTDQPSAIGSSSALALGSHVAVGTPGEIGFQSLPKEVLGAPETSKELVPGFSGSDSPEKKFKACGKVPLNSTKSDTLEAAIVDLEELANKLKWLKGILKFGIPLSNAATPSWKFVEHRGSSVSK